MATSPFITPINSTSYADVLGVQLGLVRLPGENATDFSQRLLQLAANRADCSYSGLLSQIAIDLGLETFLGIQLNSKNPASQISCSPSGIIIDNQGPAILYTVDSDGLLHWRMLSAVVADPNALSGVTATLLCADAPAVQLARQSNLQFVINEPIAGQIIRLQKGQVIPSSLLFSYPASYQFDASGRLLLSAPAPTGATISYLYTLLPYSLICSELGLFSITDPQANFITPFGDLIYQVKETLTAIAAEDPCYWGR